MFVGISKVHFASEHGDVQFFVDPSAKVPPVNKASAVELFGKKYASERLNT